MPRLIVVGDTDADLYYIVDHIPTWDEGVIVKDCFYKPGGKGANTASAASRMGEDTGLLSVVGDDDYGKKALAELKKNGVDISGVKVTKDYDTYHCITILDNSGEKALLVRTTEIVYPLPEQFVEMQNYLCSAKHAHFIALNPERMAAPARAAKEKGVTISIDLDAAYPGLEKCRELIGLTDILIVNRQGAENLLPNIEIKEKIRRFLDMGPSTVIITLGSKGVAAGNRCEYYEFPAYNVDVVDTSGSGDVFSAAVSVCSVNGWSLKEMLQFASAAAAYSIREIGAQGALPSKEDIENFITERGTK